MRARPYPKYKPSGVEWLGDMPAHWGSGRLSGLFRLRSGGTPSTEIADYWDGDIPWVSAKDMKSLRIVDAEDHITSRAVAESATSVVPAGTVLIVARSGILKHTLPVAVNERQVAINQDIKGLLPQAKRIDSLFFAYWIQGHQPSLLTLWRQQGATVESLDIEKIKVAPVPLPPPQEQRTIADFLDRETAKIDSLVSKKRTLIERLQERRIALVSRTVARGLPPDVARAAGLDPHPKLKASGIDWLGDVPAHWEVKAIKWESPVLRGASPRPIDNEVYFDEEGEYAWVRIADVSAAGMYLHEATQRLSTLGLSLSVPLQPGALFLSIAGSVGKPCITAIKCCIHDGFVYFPFWRGEARFLYYLFASGEPYKGLGKLGTQLNLNTDTVGSIITGFPPRAEQRAIADFLDRETDKIDTMIVKVETAIVRLQEYRSALITAAVTGKIDVRGTSPSAVAPG